MKDNYCPVWEITDLMSKKWNLFLIKEIYEKKNPRFNDLLNNLGVNPRTLTIRLKELENWELIKKNDFKSIPPRVEYTITEKGAELFKSFAGLEQWAKKFVVKK